MPTNKKNILWVFSAILIATIAQGILLVWLGMPLNMLLAWVGLALYALAGIFLNLGLRSLDALPPLAVSTTIPPHKKKKPQVIFWAISLSLSSIIAVYATQAIRTDARGYLFAGFWLLSIGVAIFGVLREVDWRPPPIETVKNWLKTHRAELFIVITIVMAAFVIRIVDIELFPYAFNNDEGNVGSSANCILQGDCKNFFTIQWAAQPALAYFSYAISIGLFGKTAFAVRLISVLTGTLSVLTVYCLAREMFNRQIGWLSAIFLAVLPVHIHFSRMGVDNIVDSLTTPLMLWLLLRGARRSSRLSFLAAGILAGLCLYTYPGSLLAPAFGISALGLLTLHTRGFLRVQAGNILTLVLAATVIVTPLMGYYATHSEFFMARMKRDGLFQNDNLQKQIQKTGKSAAETLVEQFSFSSLVYIVTGAPLNFYNSPKPYLPPFEAVIFMFGLAYIIWRIKDPRCLILFIWFWTVVILGSALTKNPPSSQRILMSLPALAIITALGLSKIVEALTTRFGQPLTRFMPAFLLLLIVLTGYANLAFYFHDYRLGHYYEDLKDELTYETRIYTEPLHQQGRVYLIADPKVPYLQFESFNYFAPDVEKRTLNEITLQVLLKLPYDKDALFIALPGYENEFNKIVQIIPGGEWHEVKRRYQLKDTLFYSYKISKSRLAVFSGFADGYDVFRIFP